MTNRSYRYAVICLCSLAVFLEYATRVNINNAIVSMTNEVIQNKSSQASDFCPVLVSEGTSNSTNEPQRLPMGDRYDWSPTTQGLILGAFYYGYIILQVPSGRLSEMFGGKLIVTIGLTASGFITLITPWITQSIPLLTASRVLLGLLQGIVLPACFCINANWMSVSERSFGFGLINVGGNLGAVFASAVTGYVSQTYGWPYSFLGLGAFTMAWTLTFWLFFVRSKPDPDEVAILSNNSMNGSVKSMTGSSKSDVSLRGNLPRDKPSVPCSRS